MSAGGMSEDDLVEMMSKMQVIDRFGLCICVTTTRLTFVGRSG
jgi:hypothetical protein